MSTCNDMTKNVFYVIRHEINQTQHENMVRNFFGIRTPASPVPKSKDDIGYDGDAVSCESHYIQYEFEEQDYSHADVELSPKPLPLPFRALILGPYSIQFFKGLEYLFPTGTFWFSKGAITDGGDATLLIQVREGMSTVYYGDLTNMYP